MILTAFNIADELRAFVNHNLRGLVHDFRIRVDSHRLYDEIEAVVFCVALCVEERPILALGFHFVAAHGGYTFLHEFGFLDAPGFVDFRGVHRHTVRTCANNIKRAVLFGGADIEVACHCELLAFTVFGHFREKARELDVIACDGVGREYFVNFDIGEVFAIGLVFHFEIFGGDVPDFVAVGDDVDFNGVILVGEISFGDVNGNAAEALLDDFVVYSRRVRCYARKRLCIRERSEYQSWDVTQNDPTNGVGQRHIDFVDGESEFTSFVGFRNDARDVFGHSGC